MVVDKTFYELFSDYFRVYLPQFKKRSEHTIRSYRTALNSLLDFVAAEKKVTLAEISFEMIDAAVIAKYLTSLDEQGDSLSVLTALKHFILTQPK
jgi:site-specific recombinase XerD